MHRDPTFDEVARREALVQREAEQADRGRQRQEAWKGSEAYRRQRRRRIRRLLAQALRGR
ncbi:hypothetical protein [Pseudogulbenkiania ferrooxidans]|uniref:Uncharacterized protein n=1 Tax=Pseudogulbenkiania ferrooxidans EGD-HP2 TaxID=1388764 RepID=A0ABN0N7N9_9NEIS|nr:hypothetical protein [Pseudogulbenkiania ferrooxidans]ERE07202.1 hypothetical protein O166_06460 [Pseudogulbenkiania ferrooxidans EGD-HP2]